MRWYDEIKGVTVHNKDEIKGFVGEYRWLSNFYKAPTEYDELIYPSSENAYQAAKCMDHMVREQFLTCTPGESKKLSRKIDPFFLYEDWDEIKFGVMFDCVMDKFIRNSDLCIKLLATEDRYLEETNTWGDKFWGVCNGVGKNKLGIILMHVREELRSSDLPF